MGAAATRNGKAVPLPPSRRAWPADHVEQRPVAELTPYARNARQHSATQVQQIAASIREFGFAMPVLCDEAGEIIAGHGRVLAAQQLGLVSVPCIVARGWSAAQKQAYVLTDNKLTLNANWDDELLALELADLKSIGFDLGLTGFAPGEIAEIFGRQAARGGLTDPDAVPEPPKTPISKPGDVWTCGQHRVRCGDATVLGDIEALLAGDGVAMTFTDPPYNVDYANTAKDKQRGKARPILNDALGDGFAAFLLLACRNILTVTEGAIYVCMSSSELATLQRVFRDAGGKWSTFVIWAKNAFTMGRADYQRQYEPILYGWKEGGDHYWCGARDQGDVWFIDRSNKNELHPTMKPVELVERALLNSSRGTDIVLDPFGGSGTTMIAAERAGRRARLLEMDPRYVDVIVKRWEDYTGAKAVRDG